MSRFIVMSIPDNNDGAFWFVYDTTRRTSVRCDSYEAAVERARTLKAGIR